MAGQAKQPIPAEELKRAGSFVEDMKQRGIEPEVQFLEKPTLVKLDGDMLGRFWPIGSQQMVRRYRLQLADAVPYRIIDSYYPADLFAEILQQDIGSQPLFEWLEEAHQVVAKYAHEDLSIRPATDKELTLLKLQPQAPVLEMRRTVFSETGRIIEWAYIVMPPDRYVFSYEYKSRIGTPKTVRQQLRKRQRCPLPPGSHWGLVPLVLRKCAQHATLQSI